MSEIITPNKTRLLSLDFFRGITVAAMILVNNQGDWTTVYAPLKHATWNGCTPTDLIFPFFLFIVGVSIAFALGSKKENKTDHFKLIGKAFKRAVILFGLGLFLAYFPHITSEPIAAFKTLRIPGVLQRIAIVYFITALIFIKTQPKTQISIIVALLFGYWAVMTLIPVPGFGSANLESATNFAAWVDRTLLTEAHVWEHSKTWDPEGVLSTFPAIASGLMGLLIGNWLRRKDHEDSVKVSWMFSAGCLLTLGGIVWDSVFPMNKALWTSSFVLYTAGLATITLTLSYWFIDVIGLKKGVKPFVAFGTNAISAYFIAGLIRNVLGMIRVKTPNGSMANAKILIYESFYLPYFSPLNASLAYGLTYVFVFFLIVWMMYKRNVIIKV